MGKREFNIAMLIVTAFLLLTLIGANIYLGNMRDKVLRSSDAVVMDKRIDTHNYKIKVVSDYGFAWINVSASVYDKYNTGDDYEN